MKVREKIFFMHRLKDVGLSVAILYIKQIRILNSRIFNSKLPLIGATVLFLLQAFVNVFSFDEHKCHNNLGSFM